MYIMYRLSGLIYRYLRGFFPTILRATNNLYYFCYMMSHERIMAFLI